MNYTVVFESTQGREHGLLGEQPVAKKTELMHSAYISAQRALEGVIKTSDEWNARHNTSLGERDDLGFYGYANNIIAFCAPRGQGKTSAMLSYSRFIVRATTAKNEEAQCLQNPQRCNDKDEDYNSFSALKGKRFYALPPIDPTMLREDESVIFLVLGKLFQEIQTLWEKNSVGSSTGKRWTNNEEENQKLHVLKRFQRCYDWYKSNWKNSKQADEYTDDFEEILQNGDIFEIKEEIWQIIQYFFELRGRSWTPKDSFLLITLDDTDMQFENAYRILEEVRMYLSLPNVVVMMATYLDQLRSIIEQHYRDVLKGSEKQAGIHRMTAKYLDKLIPVSQTVYLPTLRLGREMGMDYQIRRYDGNDDRPKDIERVLFDKIYEKTGMVFVRHDGYMHNLLPATLRGVQHLLRFIDGMESVDRKAISWALLPDFLKNIPNIEVELRKQQENLRLFESYFLNDWCSSRLKEEDWAFIKQMHDAASVRRIKYALKGLPKHAEVKLKKEDGAEEIEYIQLINLLYQLEDACLTEEEYRFTFALRTYLGIQLHKLALLDTLDYCALRSVDQRDATVNEKYACVLYRRLYEFLIGRGLKNDEKITSKTWEDFPDSIKGRLETTTTPEEIIACLIQLLPLEIRGDISERKDCQKDIYELQIRLIYILCNWDIQDQLFKLLKSNAQKQVSDFFKEFKEKIVDDTNGKRAPHPINLISQESKTIIDNINVIWKPLKVSNEADGAEAEKQAISGLNSPENDV